MAHTTVILDTRSRKKDGTFPVKIRVTHKGEFYISPKVNIQPEQLKNGIIVNHPLASRYNNLIAARKLVVDRQLVDLQDSGKLDKMTCSKLKEFLEKGTSSTVIYLSKYLDKYLERVHNKKTESTFRTMFSKVSKFCAADTGIPNLFCTKS